jgi:hypothetical protein
MRVTSGLGLVGLFALAVQLPVSAHHAHGNYESAFTDFTGVVKEVHFLNPHSWVYVDVKNAKGDVETWAMEAAGRQGLARIGVDANYIKAGDTIKARCHVLKDGSTGCLLGFLKGRDGTVKDWDTGGQQPVGEF